MFHYTMHEMRKSTLRATANQSLTGSPLRVTVQVGFNVRLPTRPVAVVENDRSSVVLRQLPFDLPHQMLSLFLVCLARLPTNQLLYLGITVIVSVELRTAPVKLREGLVRVSGTLQVEADAVVLAHHLGEKIGGVDRLELTIDIDLLQLIDQNDRRVAVVRDITDGYFNLEMVIWAIAVRVHDLPGLRSVLLHVGIIARQLVEHFRRHAP